LRYSRLVPIAYPNTTIIPIVCPQSVNFKDGITDKERNETEAEEKGWEFLKWMCEPTIH